MSSFGSITGWAEKCAAFGAADSEGSPKSRLPRIFGSNSRGKGAADRKSQRFIGATLRDCRPLAVSPGRLVFLVIRKYGVICWKSLLRGKFTVNLCPTATSAPTM